MKRVLIKISGEMLSPDGEGIYDAARVAGVARDILQVQSAGYEVVVVVGGGNVWRAKDTTHLELPRVTSDYLGMTATIMNAVVLVESLRKQGGSALAYGPPHMIIPTGTRAYAIDDARQALDKGMIVICSGGVFQPYSTTDSAAIQRALELECSLVVKTTKVDGLYDKDPLQYDDAVRFSTISYDEALRLQVAVMDLHALALARENNVVLYICHMDQLAMIGTTTITGTRVHV